MQCLNIHTKLEITCEVSGLPKNETGRCGLTFSTMLIMLKHTERIQSAVLGMGKPVTKKCMQNKEYEDLEPS
jgi:hypothetical protein